MYLAYPTPYSETLLENGDTSDYGDSVSSACNTPVSPVFPSANSSIDQDEEVTQSCLVGASKSDGNIMCKDCFKNQLELNKNNSLDTNLKSRSCPECRTAFSGDSVAGHASTTNAKDAVNDTVASESRSLYLSAKSDANAASIVSCDDSVSEIESSMSSSTATVILDTSEGDTNVENSCSLSGIKSTESLIKEMPESKGLAEELSSPEEESCKGYNEENMTVDGPKCSKGNICDEEGTECVESSSELLTKSSSTSTLTSTTQGTSPSTSTLRPSSSELFTRYLDMDGLTYVSDPVQERLRQIEMVHRAKVESLQRQLMDARRRQTASGDGGVVGQTSDLSDEVVRKQQAPVVQRPDNFIRWIRHYSGSKIYFMLKVVQSFRTLTDLTVVRVCIFACTRGNTEIFAQIETVG